jgi:translation initiation factor 3 subunit A
VRPSLHEEVAYRRPLTPCSKRAQELIGVEQQQAALTLLHEHVTSKRTRNSPIASLEPVMILFVELCVDLRKGKLAKDGLYQYKNTAQNTNVGTIEVGNTVRRYHGCD